MRGSNLGFLRISSSKRSQASTGYTSRQRLPSITKLVITIRSSPLPTRTSRNFDGMFKAAAKHKWGSIELGNRFSSHLFPLSATYSLFHFACQQKRPEFLGFFELFYSAEFARVAQENWPSIRR